jgi:hypothetical protein
MDYQFHPSQKENAKKIYEAICLGFSYILFHLIMQGGKTGSYLKAALDLLHDPESTIDNVVIIGGFSDTALTSQLKRDVKYAIEKYSEDKHPTNSIEARLLRNLLTKKIKVYTGNELKKMSPLSNNTLVIHDEPHHAAAKTNIPYKYFYKPNNIEKALYGDFTQLKERNIIIISIGATSFAEHISNKKVGLDWTEDEVSQFNQWVTEKKHVIYGEKGENYYGIADYLRDGRIIFENDIEKILSQIENKEGYVIIRTWSKKHMDLQSFALKHNMDYKSLTGGMGEEVFDFLETKPHKMSLVHICGLGRMGKVLCKTHINCVIETSLDPNIDTVLQALPGRMCGYGIPPNIKIYVQSNTKDGIEKYSRDELCSIDRAMNVTKQKSTSKHTIGYKTKDKSGKWWMRTVPIKILPKIHIKFEPGETMQKMINTKEDFTNKINNALAIHRDLTATNPDKETIIEQFNLKKSERVISGSVRDSDKDGYIERKSKETFDKASQNNTREWCGAFTTLITNNFTSEIETKGSFGLFGNKDVLYLYGYIKTTAPSKDVKLPDVKPKSNYFPSIQEDGETLDSNGGQIISFPSKTSTNIQLFETELISAIERTIKTNSKYIPGIESKISSIYDCGTKQHQGIFLDRTIFTKQNNETIVDRLNKKYSIKITQNKPKLTLTDIKRVFPTEKWFRYTSISWEHTK